MVVGVFCGDFLSPATYNHFLLYVSSITIISCSGHERYRKDAKLYLDVFVRDFCNHHGTGSMGSNVHNLQHVAEVVERFGQLESYSSYPFENHLQIVKRWVRAGNNCLERVITRSTELAYIQFQASAKVRRTFPQIRAKADDDT